MFNKIKMFILLLLLTVPIYTYAYSDYIIASGENIGIKLNTNGIIVIGRYDDTNSSLGNGDIITSINKQNNINIDSFTKIVSKINNGKINIGYIRDGKQKNIDLNIKNGKTGLYLKDTILGIGTLTFIDPNTKIYGALGHEIVDSSTGKIINNSSGNIYESKVIDIKRSDSGIPGEKNATINNNINLGDIDSNTEKGLFGDYLSEFDSSKLYKVANKDNIKIGNAYILTELDDNKVNKYEIEILNYNKRDKVKNIIFKVTDKRLMDVGGIVQGMSGSPIIQGDYIIGAVTHVVIDNPLKGYGILITNMLEEAEKKDE